MLDKYLTTEQVAELLQVHPFTILKFIKNGKIKGAKIGRIYRINENDVREFLENMTVRQPRKKETIEEKPILEKPTIEKQDIYRVPVLKKEEPLPSEVYII